MATTIANYIAKCQEIVDAQPAYKHGASDLKECDCIGMDKYSFRENGVKFSTTGTNYSYRNQVENCRKISSNLDLNVGDVVFKAYEQGESGWDLPAKYQPGGSAYNGDLRDYYHIGTVKSVEPLQIIHMTSPSAKTDTKIGSWKFAANWKDEYISDSPEPEPPGPGPEPPTPVGKDMKVYAENGKPVNLRKGPSKKYALVDKVPCGEIVSVDEEKNEWSHVTWNGKTGWMMSEFLVDPDEPTPEPPTPETGYAKVTSANGKPVKLRAKPSTNCNLYDELPVGTIVYVTDYEPEWSKVDYGIRKGWYMMSKFLKMLN